MEHKICISFYLRSATVHLHRSTLNGINNPSFVRFLIGNDRKSFAVQSCEKKDFYSIRTRIDQADKIDKSEIYSYGLCQLLAQLNGWDLGGSYRVYGKAFTEQGVAVFDFSSSEIINENESD